MKLRYWFRLTKAFLMRFKSVLFAGVIAGLLIFSAARFFTPYIFPSSVSYIGQSGRFHIDEIPYEITSQIGEGLTTTDETGNVAPGLAKSWEYSDEGKVWTFTIDTDKMWHDGTYVSSYDINYAFEDAQVSRPDEQTIVFTLNAPFSPFPVVVSRPVFKKGLLGTGEWEVLDIDVTNEFVEKITLVNAHNEKKVIKFYPTEEAVKDAYKLGQIDIISDLLDPFPFSEWDTVTTFENINDDRFVAVFFNNESDIFAGNKELRQALSYAINKEDFNAPRAIGPISPSSWAYNSQIKDYKYDVDRAEELYDSLSDEMKENLSINLTTSPVLLTTAEKVAGYWKEIGIDVQIHVSSILPEQYDAFLAIYNVPKDPDQYAIWHGSQVQTNLSKLSSQRLNLLLEQGRLELDQQERKRIYLDFQRFLLEEAPAVFLYHPLSYTVARK